MNNTPSYYRARIAAIEHLLKIVPESDKKNNDRVLLRNGLIPEEWKADAEKFIQVNKQAFSDEPLNFSEITRFSNWFAMHPEKVAGTESVTTSLHFPITIKGSKEQIIATIEKEVAPDDAELEALALEAELELMSFKFSE